MDGAGQTAISPSRKRLALLILAIIVIGQSVDILLQREDWPFSNYPMYAKLIRKRQTSLLRLYGRVTDGKAQWVMPIVDDNLVMYVPPINELRMKNILEYALGHGGEKGVRRVLRDYMAMYEERRILGQQGTPVQGPRMLEAICMRITWTLDARGGAVGQPRMEEVTAASAFPSTQPVGTTTAPVSVSEVVP